MNILLLYLLKTNIVLLGGFIFYWIFLRSSTFYRWNRYYFLVCGLISGIIPLVRPLNLFELNIQTNVFNKMVSLNPNDLHLLRNTTENTFYIDKIILTIIGLGASLFLFRFIIRMISLYILYKNSEKKIIKGKTIHILKKEIGPFSFLNRIFLNPNLHTEDELDEIINHEFIHVKEFHTIDVLLYEFLTIICWYNPFIWFMKNSMKQNLEYQVDQQVINSGHNKYHYQSNLLRVARIHTHFDITNNLYFKFLKHRIIRMNQKQSTRISLFKYLLIIPLLIGMNQVINAKNTERDSKSTKEIAIQLLMDMLSYIEKKSKERESSNVNENIVNKSESSKSFSFKMDKSKILRVVTDSIKVRNASINLANKLKNIKYNNLDNLNAFDSSKLVISMDRENTVFYVNKYTLEIKIDSSDVVISIPE